MSEAKAIAENICREYIEKEKLNIDIILVEYQSAEEWGAKKKSELENMPKEVKGRGTYDKTIEKVQEINAKELINSDIMFNVVEKRFEKITGEKFNVSKIARHVGISSNTMDRVLKGKAKKRDYLLGLAIVLQFNEDEIKKFFEINPLGMYELTEDSDAEVKIQIKRERIIKDFIKERKAIIDGKADEVDESVREHYIKNWKDILEDRLNKEGYVKLYKKCLK